jgi:hypothetical protein
MAWGDSWGRAPGRSPKAVAEAFYAGRPHQRTNCGTDGHSYKLSGLTIASRVWPEHELHEITNALKGLPHRRSLEFSFAGYPTPMTCRHLRALGVDCDTDWFEGRDAHGKFIKVKVALMRGRRVDPNRFYTLEELAEMPEWKRPVEEPRTPRNMTKAMNLELNFG